MHPCGDERDQRVAVLDAAPVVGESRVVEKILEVDRAAEAFEERVVGAADVHEPIRRAERLIGHDRGVHIAFRMGHRAVGEIARRLPREQRHLSPDHRRVDDLSLAGPMPGFERRDDRERREHPRHHVGLRHTDHHRVAAGWTGEAHHAAHPLHHEVVRRPRTPRPILPEPGDMADDRLAVHRTNPVVGKTETPENSGTEVLDHDVGAFD